MAVDGSSPFEFDIEVTGATPVVLVPSGVPGPPGADGNSFAGFVHTQATPAATWVVTHTLGRFPFSALVTINGEVVIPDVTFTDSSTVVVTFASPAVGALRLV